jgi:hypothetical protein
MIILYMIICYYMINLIIIDYNCSLFSTVHPTWTHVRRLVTRFCETIGKSWSTSRHSGVRTGRHRGQNANDSCRVHCNNFGPELCNVNPYCAVHQNQNPMQILSDLFCPIFILYVPVSVCSILCCFHILSFSFPFVVFW